LLLMSSDRSRAIQIVQQFHAGGVAADRALEQALGIARSRESRSPSLAALLHRFGNQNFTFEAAPFHALREIFRAVRPKPGELFCDAGAGYGHAVFYGACVAGCRFRAIEILPARCNAMQRTARRLGLGTVEIVQGDALQQNYADVRYLLVNSPFFPPVARRFIAHVAQAREAPLTVIALHNIVESFRSAAEFTEVAVEVDIPRYYFGVFHASAR
jgi:predicted RNA methylase